MFLKKILIIVLIQLLILVAVSAQTIDDSNTFNADKSYNWLISQQNSDGSWNDNIIDTSLAILALKKANLPTKAEIGADWLEIQNDMDGCFPFGNCQITDTAFALLALNSMGRDTTTIASWLKNAQTPTSSADQWFIQVYPNSDGLCEIKYSDNGQLISNTFTIQDNKIEECNDESWYDLVSCLPGNPLNTNPSRIFEVDCSQISGNINILLMYKAGNSYYVLQKESSRTATINVDSGCWGTTRGSSCDIDSSLYSNWALIETSVLSETLGWIRDNSQTTNSLHNSLLYLSSNKQKDLDNLINSQQSSGSWNNNVYDTSFAVLALSPVVGGETASQSGTNWLASQQSDDGSWGNSVRDTAITLHSAFSNLNVNCGDNFCDQGETVTCPSDCPDLPNQNLGETICDNNIDDDNDGFTDCTDVDCQSDIACLGSGETICDDNIDNDNDGSTDCSDTDCYSDSSCDVPSNVEICDDSIDNDGDGFTDCSDSNCDSNVNCIPIEICDNGIDDDNNGDTDEEDINCIGFEYEDESSSAAFWIIFLLIILLITGGIFLLYKKNPKIFTNIFKKKPKGPPSKSKQTYQSKQQSIQGGSIQQKQYISQRKTSYRKKKQDPLSKSIRDFKKSIGKK